MLAEHGVVHGAATRPALFARPKSPGRVPQKRTVSRLVKAGARTKPVLFTALIPARHATQTSHITATSNPSALQRVHSGAGIIAPQNALSARKKTLGPAGHRETALRQEKNGAVMQRKAGALTNAMSVE